jgi:putative hydrolase of the HAD superfamily
VASGECAQWMGSVLCEQSDGPGTHLPGSAQRYLTTIEPALRYPDAGVPNAEGRVGLARHMLVEADIIPAVVGVVFDLFETLVTEGSRWLARSHGVPSWQERAAERLGVSDEQFRRGWRRLKDVRMTVRMPYGEALRSICDDTGVAVASSVIGDLVLERQSAKAVPFFDVDTAVVAMLDELTALAVPMAVLSNCSGEEVEMLADSAIGSRITHRLLSCDIGCAKPAREAYLTAAERLGLAPEDCLFVGDGSIDELLGARAAGMRPVWATWFMPGWPPALAATHEAVIAQQRVERALTPSDVVAVVRHAIDTRT